MGTPMGTPSELSNPPPQVVWHAQRGAPAFVRRGSAGMDDADLTLTGAVANAPVLQGVAGAHFPGPHPAVPGAPVSTLPPPKR